MHKLPLQHLGRAGTQDCKTDLCVQSAALGALQEAREASLWGLYKDASMGGLHAKRVTTVPETSCEDLAHVETSLRLH